eukprot:TRINITY_DN1414_c0_g1_i1.p1 TRINITY_DN1414_c0_g1~~TRINITY_DN1414_c0_g1_i1.p1  ORF type:complete len:445 (+),score=51.73 TRINITY_DN1414_c0_g1_i1:116-1450(+)
MFLLGICYASWIVDRNGTHLVYLRTVRYIYSTKKDNFTSIILPISTDTKKLDTCKSYMPPPTVPGAIIFGSAYGDCELSKHAELAQSMNASAAFFVTLSIDAISLLRDGDFKNVKIPVFLIDRSTIVKMGKIFAENYKNKLPTYVYLKEDENTFELKTDNGGWIFFQVVLLSILFISFLMAIRGLFLNFRHTGASLTIQKICLANNMISIVFLFCTLLDPWGSHKFTNYAFVFTTLTLSIPCILISLSLVSFFLNEVMIQKKMMEPKLDFFKYPFFILSFILWAIYLSFAIVVDLRRAVIELVRTAGIISCVYIFFCLIYFGFVSVTMIIRLSKFKNKMIKRILPLAILQSFGTMLLSVVVVLFTVQYFLATSYARLFMGCWIIYYIAGTTIIAAQVFTFKDPKISTTKSGSKESKNTRDKVNMLDNATELHSDSLRQSKNSNI